MELYRWYILKYGAYALLAVALFRLQSIPRPFGDRRGAAAAGGGLGHFGGHHGAGAARRIVLHLLRVSV